MSPGIWADSTFSGRGRQEWRRGERFRAEPRRKLLRRRDRLRGRLQYESFAHEDETGLGQFGLEQLIFGTGEEIGMRAVDGRHQMMHRNGLTVECSLLVGIRG